LSAGAPLRNDARITAAAQVQVARQVSLH
jgi:hypothetical protein